MTKRYICVQNVKSAYCDNKLLLNAVFKESVARD